MKYDNLLLKLGNKIRYERMKRNLSQENLAELIGLSTPSVSNLERGVTNIKFTTFYNIVKALDLDLKDLLDFKL
jgi:XRE family transcriptional regulator, regulator of sulfur utilization